MKKIFLLSLLALSVSHNAYSQQYTGPGSPSYTQQQEQLYWQMQQQANINATAQGWNSHRSSWN